MKVGDLVQLSGYGATRGFNSQLTMIDTKQTGLIIRVDEVGYYRAYPYIVLWSKVDQSGSLDWCHHRRELKYAGR